MKGSELQEYCSSLRPSKENISEEVRMIGIIFLIAYTVIMVTVTVIFSKKVNSKDSFYVGDRKMGPVKMALSIAATWIWAPALFTSAEKAYTNGIAGLFWFVVPNVACLLIFIPFAKMIRKQMPQGITLSGYIYDRYKSKAARNAYTVELVVLSILSTGVQLLAGGEIMSIVTGIPFPVMTVILAAIAYSYSRISGIQASVITDDLQMIMIFAVCMLFVPMALSNGGAAAVVKGIRGITGEYGNVFSRKGLEVFLSFGLPTAIGLISGPFGDQCFWQRAFCTEEKNIGKAFALGAVFFAVAPISMGIIGFLAAGTGFVPASAGTVNFELITSLFPQWAVLPFLFMLISGLLSTIDSNLCAIASLTTDFDAINHGNLLARISMLVLLFLGITVANIPGVTVTQLFLFYGTLRASTLLPTILTLKNVRITGRGVTLGVILSMVMGLPIFAYGNIAGIALFKTIGSLLTVGVSGITCLIKAAAERSHANAG